MLLKDPFLFNKIIIFSLRYRKIKSQNWGSRRVVFLNGFELIKEDLVDFAGQPQDFMVYMIYNKGKKTISQIELSQDSFLNLRQVDSVRGFFNDLTEPNSKGAKCINEVVIYLFIAASYFTLKTQSSWVTTSQR